MSHPRYRTGTRFEDRASYSRAVRAGDRIVVSGTADLGPDGTVRHPGDVHAQTTAAIATAVTAVESLGGRRDDVVLTRLYLLAGADWDGAVRAHGEAFADIDPANTTLFVAGFIPEGVLVEVELEAVSIPAPDSVE